MSLETGLEKERGDTTQYIDNITAETRENRTEGGGEWESKGLAVKEASSDIIVFDFVPCWSSTRVFLRKTCGFTTHSVTSVLAEPLMSPPLISLNCVKLMKERDEKEKQYPTKRPLCTHTGMIHSATSHLTF